MISPHLIDFYKLWLANLTIHWSRRVNVTPFVPFWLAKLRWLWSFKFHFSRFEEFAFAQWFEPSSFLSSIVGISDWSLILWLVLIRVKIWVFLKQLFRDGSGDEAILFPRFVDYFDIFKSGYYLLGKIDYFVFLVAAHHTRYYVGVIHPFDVIF